MFDLTLETAKVVDIDDPKKEGKIQINLDVIIDKDVCRLIIKLNDNGKGYTYGEIEESLKNRWKFEKNTKKIR